METEAAFLFVPLGGEADAFLAGARREEDAASRLSSVHEGKTRPRTSHITIHLLYWHLRLLRSDLLESPPLARMLSGSRGARRGAGW
jgi:hypothetical protein